MLPDYALPIRSSVSNQDSPWTEPTKFKFGKGDEIQFNDTRFYIYECNVNYVTIAIRKKYATAELFQFMESKYDAIYLGVLLEWADCSHLTFKRKL